MTVSAFLPPSTPLPSHGLFAATEYAQMRAFFSMHPELRTTPLTAIPALGDALGVSSLHVKDESGRFGLNAFKLLGARFAIETLLAEGAITTGSSIVCASEGNHGRAVARAAREAGCRARVYMAHDAAQARVDAIASEGADVIRVEGSYDDSVRLLQAEATQHGWTIVSDASWPGYERIPRLIMLGYSRLLDEITELTDPDVLFVQGGVGGLLCGVASWCAMHRPSIKVVCVEPASAACIQASARAGHPVAVTGPLNTAMAGLRNREVSPLAFDSVRSTVAAFLAIDDAWTEQSMRHLNAAGIGAGASGAAALGGLLAVCQDASMHAVRAALGLAPSARVVAIVSEGVTDPAHWHSVIARA